MPNNTHILIPITEELTKAINEAYLEDIFQAIQNGKQISLDEKDIEEKAIKSSVENCKFVYPKIERAKFKKGYKQALKDLL